MCNNSRILNLTSGRGMTAKQVQRMVDSYVLAWVERGVSVRTLTAKESIELLARQNEPLEEMLPLAECLGLIYRVKDEQQAALRRERDLAREADQFYFAAVGV